FSHLALIPVPVALAGLVLIGCARWMPVRTAKGTDLARRLLGFRRYLTTTAAGQARPAGQADLLDDYLPYAIGFGCTKQWAELSAAVTGAGQAPSWYRSSGPYVCRATCRHCRGRSTTSRPSTSSPPPRTTGSQPTRPPPAGTDPAASPAAASPAAGAAAWAAGPGGR